jgi:hypothetical protein
MCENGDGAGDEQGEAGGEAQADGDAREALVVARQAAGARQPRERALNGLITNDKFCLMRHARLRLRWRSRGGAPPRDTHG